jgi:glycosyltransferase involved in cell wall biosynthesis
MGAGMKRTPTLSVVMPCLNEEENIEAAVQSTLDAFDRHGIDGELIVVNDGSTDKTREIVYQLMARDRRVLLLDHDKPMGIGVSFWDGVKQSKDEYVTMFPGDNENNPEEALSYFGLTECVDIIIPFVHNSEIRSRWRRIISSCYRFIINVSFGMSLNYMNGTVIYNTAILKEIWHHSTGFFYQTETLIRLIRAGYLYAEVPHFLQQRSSGQTKALSLRSLWNVTRGYFRLMWDIHIFRKIGTADLEINKSSATYHRQRKDLDQSPMSVRI